MTMTGESSGEVKAEVEEEEESHSTVEPTRLTSTTAAIPVASGTKKLKVLTVASHSK